MKWFTRIVYLIVFVLSIVLIITGQRSIGPVGLVFMLIGLVGILFLLYLYNKKYQ